MCGAQPGIDNRKKVAGEPERAKDQVRLAPHLVLLIFGSGVSPPIHRANIFIPIELRRLILVYIGQNFGRML